MSALQRIFLSRNMEHVKYLRYDKPADLDIHLLHATDEILNHFTNWLSRQTEVALDIETNHIDPYCGRILLTSLYAENQVITFDDTIPVTELLSTEKLKNTTIIAHNLKFETLWFLKHGIHFRKTHCTMLAEQKMLPGADLRNDLVSVITRRGIPIPAGMDKAIREEFGANYTKPELKHIIYNQGDVLPLNELKKIQEGMFKTLNMEFYIQKIQFPLIRTLAIAEMEGMVIDEPKFTALAEAAEKKMKDIAVAMELWINTVYPKVDLQQFNAPVVKQLEAIDKQEDRLIERNSKCYALKERYEQSGKTHLKAYQVTCSSLHKIADDHRKLGAKKHELQGISCISWTANQQVIALLIGIGCKPLPRVKDKKTGSLKPSMAKAARERWLLQNPSHTAYPLIKLYSEFMLQTKHVNSFGKTFLSKYKHPVTGRFHTSYKQGTVETGRLASGSSDMTPPKFNSQQLPPVIRDSFKTVPGYLIATCDLSGAELITMCSVAQDHRLLELSKTTDLHSYFANLGWQAIYAHRGILWTDNDVISKDQNSKKRRAYKPMLFGTVYGLRGPKAAETLNVSEEEGGIAIRTITREIPATMKMVSDASKFAMKHGYVIHNTRTNSRRWFPAVINARQGNCDMDFISKVTVDGAARNTKIQGTQSDFICEAMVLLQRYIDRYKIDVKLLLTVHDELVVKFKEEYKDWFPQRLKDCMIRSANKYLTGGVKMEADLKTSDCWTK